MYIIVYQSSHAAGVVASDSDASKIGLFESWDSAKSRAQRAAITYPGTTYTVATISGEFLTDGSALAWKINGASESTGTVGDLHARMGVDMSVSDATSN